MGGPRVPFVRGSAERSRPFDPAKADGKLSAGGLAPLSLAQIAAKAYELGLQKDGTKMLLSPDSDFFRYFQNPSGTSGVSMRTLFPET